MPERLVMVYGRKIDDHGYTVRQESLSDGRTTYWVPEVQQ